MAKFVIANWKNYPGEADEAMALAKASDVMGLIIAPRAEYVPIVGKIIQSARLASQNRVDVGIPYAILGHSDYRAQDETDEMIARKVKSALEAGVTPIICVGESRDVHDSGHAREFVKNQLTTALGNLRDVIIAYEPIWSISTTPSATPDTPTNAASMIQFIKETLVASDYNLNPRVLYGGSVNEENAASYLRQPAIDGLLVGAASLRPESIKKIVEIAKNS